MKNRYCFFVCLILLIPFYRHSFPAGTQLPFKSYINVIKGIPNAVNKFTKRKTETVAFFGGTITHNPGWHDVVCQYLRERFPQTSFHFINAGIPSLGSKLIKAGRHILRLQLTGKKKCTWRWYGLSHRMLSCESLNIIINVFWEVF